MLEDGAVFDGGAGVEWKSCVGKIALCAMFYAAFFALKRKLCPENRTISSNARKSSDRGSMAAEHGELCPICLETPRDGVRLSCGHRICEICLKRYCKAYRRAYACTSDPKPTLCPLCRAPFVWRTLPRKRTNAQKDLSSIDLNCYCDC